MGYFSSYELQCLKTYLQTCAACEDSDHVCSLMRILMGTFWIATHVAYVANEESEQTAQMCIM